MGFLPAMKSLRRLVPQPGQALIAAQHGQNVKNRRRGGAAGEGGAQWLRNSAKLQARPLGIRPNDGFDCGCVPIGNGLELRQQRGDQGFGLPGKQGFSLICDLKRPARPQEARSFE